MRIQFQKTAWDLYVVIGYTLVLTGVLLVLGVGNVLAIVMVLFFPGYVLVAALFPSRDEIDWIERVTLSFGLSVVLVPLLGLGLNFTLYGIRFASITLVTALFTVLTAIVACLRRTRIPVERRLSGAVNLSIPEWREHGRADKALTVALSAATVAAAGLVCYAFATTRSAETFTEFYLLGPGGNASGYPTSLNVSQLGAVTLGIGNHEHAKVNYTVRIDFVEIRVLYNATAGVNRTVEVNRTTRDWFNVTLADGQNWTKPYSFRINATGVWKVQFILLRGVELSSPYRELHIFIRVA